MIQGFQRRSCRTAESTDGGGIKAPRGNASPRRAWNRRKSRRPWSITRRECRAKPYGLQSPFDVFTAARRYNLADVVEQIRTPLLITDPEGEQFWPRQSQQLFEKLPGTKQLITFTADEGADRHCEPLARSLLEQRMFDWLDETLAAQANGQKPT